MFTGLGQSVNRRDKLINSAKRDKPIYFKFSSRLRLAKLESFIGFCCHNKKICLEIKLKTLVNSDYGGRGQPHHKSTKKSDNNLNPTL